MLQINLRIRPPGYSLHFLFTRSESVFRACHKLLAEKGIEVVASAVGEILTVQETAGFQMFIARMDDELLGYWNAPCRTPYYRN